MINHRLTPIQNIDFHLAVWAPTFNRYNGALISCARFFDYISNQRSISVLFFSCFHTAKSVEIVNLLPRKKNLFSFVRLFFSDTSALLIHRSRFNHILCISPRLSSFFPLAFAKFFLGKSIIIRTSESLPNNPTHRSLYLLFFHLLSSNIISISTDIKASIDKLGLPLKVNYIPNPTYPQEATPKSYYSNDVFRILIVGRISHRKGHHLVIGALSLLISRGLKVHLTILGPPSQSASYNDKIAHMVKSMNLNPHIRFTGYVDDVTSYYKNSHVLVLPSSSEGMANSMLEAISFGLPVITTDVSGARDVVTEYHNGAFVQRSELSIADTISNIILNPRGYTQLSSNALESSTLFDANYIYAQIASLPHT